MIPTNVYQTKELTESYEMELLHSQRYTVFFTILRIFFNKGRGRLRPKIGPPPEKLSGDTWIYQFQHADFEKKGIRPSSEVNTWENLFVTQLENITVLTLWITQSDLGPLWKAVRTRQLFTLYNFASNTDTPRGGRDTHLGQKSPKTHSFHPGGPFGQVPFVLTGLSGCSSCMRVLAGRNMLSFGVLRSGGGERFFRSTFLWWTWKKEELMK